MVRRFRTIVTLGPMHRLALLLLLLLFTELLHAKSALGQLPFYTDDPEVTERGKWHFEFFNELDALQSSQYPDLRQNTANFKLNYGLPHNLEFDVDSPYLSVSRASGVHSSKGVGDTNLGLKWELHKASQDSRLPA